MAEHDYNIANNTYPALRADLNDALAAIVSNNSKATPPSTTFGNMWWYDTANDILKQRNEANSAWIEIGYFDQTNNKFVARIHETASKTASFSVAATDRNKTFLCNATSAPIVSSPLSAATAGNGFVFTTKKTDSSANTVTIDFSGSETGDGALTIVLSLQYETVTLISDGSNWSRITPAVSAASTSSAGVVTKATAAQVVSETADKYPDAALLKNHQGIAKAWATFNTITTSALLDSYNVSGLVDNGTGSTTINLGITMANTNYIVLLSSEVSASPTNPPYATVTSKTTTSVTINTRGSTNGALVDSPYVSMVIFGDI